jgi:hypothetical protein
MADMDRDKFFKEMQASFDAKPTITAGEYKGRQYVCRRREYQSKSAALPSNAYFKCTAEEQVWMEEHMQQMLTWFGRMDFGDEAPIKHFDNCVGIDAGDWNQNRDLIETMIKESIDAFLETQTKEEETKKQ